MPDKIEESFDGRESSSTKSSVLEITRSVDPDSLYVDGLIGGYDLSELSDRSNFDSATWFTLF